MYTAHTSINVVLQHSKCCSVLYVKTNLAKCSASFKQLHQIICHVVWEVFAESALLCSSEGQSSVSISDKKRETSVDSAEK